MNPRANYYDLLGVREDASQDDIKKAYRRLAKEFHPDSSGGDKRAEEQFKKISEAYRILGDREKRRQYDLMRKGGFIGSDGFNFQGPNSGSYRVEFGEGFGNVGDIFGDIFDGFPKGGGKSEGFFGGGMNIEDMFRQKDPPQSRGADMESTITIPFEMAINGGETIIKTGSGRKVRIKIPPGTEDDKKIRLRGHGEAPQGGGQAGDLYLTIKVTPHPEFERRGQDIHSNLYINLAEAVLGTEVQVKTVSGKHVKLKIPGGTSSAKIFRLPGMGVKTASEQGDHYVRIEIDVPANLSITQKREFKSWARKMGLVG